MNETRKARNKGPDSFKAHPQWPEDLHKTSPLKDLSISQEDTGSKAFNTQVFKEDLGFKLWHDARWVNLESTIQR